MDETIHMGSNVGKRLEKIKKDEKHCLLFNGREISIVKKIVIGRDKSCDVTIDDVLVSRNHAVIQKIKNAYFIHDLESTNGTYVNNKKVPDGKYVKLKKTDKIKIGKNILFIR